MQAAPQGVQILNKDTVRKLVQFHISVKCPLTYHDLAFKIQISGNHLLNCCCFMDAVLCQTLGSPGTLPITQPQGQPREACRMLPLVWGSHHKSLQAVTRKCTSSTTLWALNRADILGFDATGWQDRVSSTKHPPAWDCRVLSAALRPKAGRHNLMKKLKQRK